MMRHDIHPERDGSSEPFWAGLERGVFCAARCEGCGTYLFPARDFCHACGNRAIEDVDIAGPAVVYSFTVNHHRWGPAYAEPFGVILAEFPEHSRIRLLGLFVGDDLDSIAIGAPVRFTTHQLQGGTAVAAFAMCT
jgi:hypothetical protein